MKKPIVLVTGASTGLGLNIARFLIKQDYTLILTARPGSIHRFNDEGIYESDQLWIRTLNVTSAADRVTLMQEIKEKLDGVDVLVNNAAISYRSVLEHVTEEEQLHQMDVNFRSPMELIRLCLPYMRQQMRGKIVNISSVGGMMAMPTMAIYSASKFALEGATESLWYEMKPWNVNVTLLQPGFINSGAFEKVKLTAMAQTAMSDPTKPYHNHYKFMSGFISQIMKHTPTSEVSVAKKVLKIIKTKNPPLRMAGTYDARIFYVLRRFLPRGLYHYLLYKSLPGIRTWAQGRVSR